jgi:hypothetical protein
VKSSNGQSIFWYAITRQSKMLRSLSTGVTIAQLEHSGIISLNFVAVVNDFILSASSQDTMTRNV